VNEEGLYDQFEKQKLANIPRREIMYVLKAVIVSPCGKIKFTVRQR